MSTNLNSTVSGAIKSSIIIRMPLLSIHPYTNKSLFLKHQPKFRELIPLTHQPNYHHDCLKYEVRLNLIKEDDVFIQLYDYKGDSDFVRRLQRFILEGIFTNATKYAEKYMIIIATKELYLKTNKNYLNWFPQYYHDFLVEQRNSPSFSHIFSQLYRCQTTDPFMRPIQWTLPKDFECMCYSVWSSHQEVTYDFSEDEYSSKEEVESTGLRSYISNFGMSLASTVATNYYAYKAVNFDYSEIKNDLIADLLLFIADFNAKTLIWAFVKFLNRIFKIPNLYTILYNLFNYCHSLFSSSPAQPTTGEVESTSNETIELSTNITESMFSNFFNTLKISIPILCSIMATALVVMTGLFMGKRIFDDQSNLNRSKVKRVCEAFYQVSKAASSIKNFCNILSVWPKWVHDMSFEYILGHDHTKLESLLFTAEVRDPSGCDRRKFFDDVAYLTNPINTITISRSDDLRTKLLWCNNILNNMAINISQQPSTDESRAASHWIFTKLTFIRSAIMAIARQPSPHKTRFTPFWINMIGSSGLGKTTLIPHIMNSIKEVLKKSEDHKDEAIPEDNKDWIYSMNFCAKYMTGYAGQYCVVIDDLFQDATIVGDATPSSLLLIQMVSSQPFPTIQASIDDKGIEFTSKIIISSSNDRNINRKEIVDTNALLRRMNVRIHVEEEQDGIPFDEGLKAIGHHKNLAFYVYSFDGKTLLYKLNYNNLCAFIASQYIKWYILQKQLLAKVSSYPSNVDSIIKALESGQELENLKPNKYDALKNNTTNLTIPKCRMIKDTHEATRSVYCTLIGKGMIRNKLFAVKTFDENDFEQIEIEQYDCDCVPCSSINLSYRQHRYEFYRTDSDILSIKEYLTLCNQQPDSIIQHHQTRFQAIWEKVKNLLKEVASHPLIIIAGGLTALISIIYASSYFGKESTRLMYSSGTVPKKIHPRVMIKPLQPIRFEPTCNSVFADVESELRVAIPNQNTYDLVYKILNRSMMCILRRKSGNKTTVNSGLRIVGTCILTNHHFFHGISDGDEFEVLIHNVLNGLSIKKQVFNSMRYAQLAGIDIGIYQCDNKIPHSTDITSHFVEDSIPNMKHNSIMLSIYDPEKFSTPIVTPGIVAQPYNSASYYDGGFSTLETFSTNVNVAQGQSGSILISTEPNVHNKIIGILTCRSKTSNKGFFKPVSKQSILNALQELDVDENLSVNIEEDIEITGASQILSNNLNFECKSLNYIGRIPQSKQVTQAVSTNFIPSLISDGNVNFSPAVLHPKDERMDPEYYGKPIIFRSILGYNDEIGAVDTKELDIVVEELSVDYMNMKIPPGMSKKLLSDFQMVNGIKPYLNKFDMRTSPGYPFVKQREPGELGKYRWFNEIQHENQEKLYEMKSDFKLIVDHRERQARKGIKVSTIAYMCLKDELRQNSKIKKGETRVFTCLPMDYNLLIRKYFGAFIIVQHFNAGEISSCVGVNPAKDWYQIWLRLRTKNEFWEDFDYKNWDQHLHPELVMRVADIVSNWYGDSKYSEEAKVRRVLLHDLIHTTIMVKDCLFIKSCGQCSGCAITAELNCIVHDMLMYYVFRLHCRDKRLLCNISLYRSQVACALYGDDIIKSVVSSSDFLGQNIKPFMDKLGMNITPGDKVSTEFTLKHPSDLLFLKRSFTIDKECGGFDQYSVRAPLKKEIVLNIYKWIRKSCDPITATKENCETALREMFMYGRKEFNEQKQIINQLIENYNSQHNIPIDYISLSYDNLKLEYDTGNFDLIGFEPNC